MDSSMLSMDELKARVGELESIVGLLLSASLRGRLLPADRKKIKAYLDDKAENKKQSRIKGSASDGPICPACRLPIPDENVERCPNCSVLLDVVRKYRTS